MQIISRSKGQSAVAAASYRSGETLVDERTGETKFYKREVAPETMILAPSHAPEWVQDRQRLWNEVEKIEKNKNSQLAREFNVALPKELSNEKQTELIRNYVQNEFVNKGMVADIAIHRDDEKNPHAHVMLTIRPFNENGAWGNKKKKIYELDKNRQKVLDKKTHKPKYKTVSLTDWDKRENVPMWREQWANYTNKALEEANIKEQITHLSHKDRGLEILPTIHLGPVAHAMEEKKENSSERGKINAEIKEYNADVVNLQEYRKQKEALEQERKKAQEVAAAKEKREVQIREYKKLATPKEKSALNSAQAIIGEEPNSKNIKATLEELEMRKHDLEGKRNEIYASTKAFEFIDGQYENIHALRDQIKRKQEAIENISWKNPFKAKANKALKTQLESAIQDLTENINDRYKAISPYQDQLHFKNETEFYQLKRELPSNLNKTINQLSQISQDSKILKSAEQALQNRFVRAVAQHYPNNPEMAYLDYKTAQNLDKYNRRDGVYVPVEDLKRNFEAKKAEYQQSAKWVKTINKLDQQLENYQKAKAVMNQYEQNPYWNGKMLNNGSMPEEYNLAQAKVQDFHNSLRINGIKDMDDFQKGRTLVPKVQAELEQDKGALNLLGSLVQGINQAALEMEKSKENERKNGRKKQRSRHRSHDWGLEL